MIPANMLPDASPREARAFGAIDAMLRLLRRHHSLVEQRLGGMGVHRSQHRLLMMLSCAGGTPSQKDIAQALGVSPAAVARTLKTLETAGLVEKTGGADGRQNRICILPAGQRKIDETHSLFRTLDLQMFDGVSDGEIEAMTATLQKLRDNLGRMEQEDRPEGGREARR